MRYEWWIAGRYVWSKRRHPFVGIISTISVIGICVGVAALVVVLAVMSGFDEDLKSRIIGTHAHLVIEKDGVFSEHERLAGILRKAHGIRGVSAYVEGQALVQKEELATGVLVRGVDVENERSVSKLHNYIVSGVLSRSPGRVVVGSELAKRLHLEIGSDIAMLTQNAKKPEVFRVEGIFSSGMYEYDANLIFMNLESAQLLFNLGPNVSGLSVSVVDAEKADRAKKSIQLNLKYPYQVRTWMDMNQTLFGALKLEKIVMFLILALIIFVACLNIAGSLTILVMDKTKDIGVLKALGATPGELMRIFAADGFFIGFIGALLGLGIGLSLCIVLKNYSFIELPRDIYYFERLPVKFSLFDTSLVFLVAVFLSFLSALYPAWMAGRLDAAKALRYE